MLNFPVLLYSTLLAEQYTKVSHKMYQKICHCFPPLKFHTILQHKEETTAVSTSSVTSTEQLPADEPINETLPQPKEIPAREVNTC